MTRTEVNSKVFCDTIVAIATPTGEGAIGIIRLSGAASIAIADNIFRAKDSKKQLQTQASHTIIFGDIREGDLLVDEVLVSVFRNPHSYTGEDSIEISCHGSSYIISKIIELLLTEDCRMANPGEFTQRAFLNGKMDLSQAEAVADLIAAKSKSAHRIAIQQMRGGYSHQLNQMRQELMNFASLVELELDFSEEDVDFVDREQMLLLVDKLLQTLYKLIASFSLGNAMKDGVPVAILGKPNAGKSTLLNALLNEEKALVSDIPGTTRDAIEDTISIDGQLFRLIDTAGLRDTTDSVEQMGIDRSYEKALQAKIIIYLFDAMQYLNAEPSIQKELTLLRDKYPDKELLIVANKIDQLDDEQLLAIKQSDWVILSAKKKKGIASLQAAISKTYKIDSTEDIIVSNLRHYQALRETHKELKYVKDGLVNQLTGDLLAIDIRTALHHLGIITGQVTTDDLLGNIFSNFCVGK